MITLTLVHSDKMVAILGFTDSVQTFSETKASPHAEVRNTAAGLPLTCRDSCKLVYIQIYKTLKAGSLKLKGLRSPSILKCRDDIFYSKNKIASKLHLRFQSRVSGFHIK
jgi:hypothetical protein